MKKILIPDTTRIFSVVADKEWISSAGYRYVIPVTPGYCLRGKKKSGLITGHEHREIWLGEPTEEPVCLHHVYVLSAKMPHAFLSRVNCVAKMGRWDCNECKVTPTCSAPVPGFTGVHFSVILLGSANDGDIVTVSTEDYENSMIVGRLRGWVDDG